MRTTSKEVVNKVQEHILEQFVNGWDNPNPIGNLKEQVEHMVYNNRSQYQTAKDLVEGGTFLCYHYQVEEFLNSLGINPDNKEYSQDKSWDLYVHLLAREICKLIN